MNVDALQCFRTLLKLRRHLHDHVILVQRLVDGRNLPLPKRVVEHGIDVLHGNAQTRCRITVNDHAGFESFVLLIGIYLHE